MDDPTPTIPIPERLRADCYLCHRPLNMRSEGVYQWTAGWVKNRSGGGGHAVSLPQRENRWAHGHCVDLAANQIRQKDLF